MTSLEMSAATYARRIERLWGERIGRPVVLSPRDWTLVNDWHAHGIPLQIVEEQMAAAVERARRRGRAPRPALWSLATAIDDAWGSIVDGRVDSRPRTESTSDRTSAEQAWRDRLDAAPPASPLAGLLERLLGRLEGGANVGEVDADLDRNLADAVERSLLLEVEAGVERDLSPHRERIDPARMRATRLLARAQRLRERLRLPRLAPPGAPG